MIHSGKTVLVDFFADWCGPCKLMGPILQDLRKQVGEDVSIIKVDVDKNPQVASAYQVSGIPTLIIFKNGIIKWRQSGVVPAHQLKQVLSGISNS